MQDPSLKACKQACKPRKACRLNNTQLSTGKAAICAALSKQAHLQPSQRGAS